jgi:hypothetical protein
LSAYTLSRGDPEFIHQHAVDAYGAQHAGSGSSNIGVAFALIGLHLALEKGLSGRQVQRAHMQLGSLKKSWPKLEPPSEPAKLTVLDVVNAAHGESRDQMLRQWAKAVWDSWEHAHAWTRHISNELLQHSFSTRRPSGRKLP